MRKFVIEDAIHLDWHESFASLDAALERVRRLARTPWSKPPNRAPCIGWETCGREWEILDYDVSETPWQLRARIPALAISRDGATWHSPFRAHRPFARKSRSPGPGRNASTSSDIRER